MVRVHTQDFYERSTGKKHEVVINFGCINPLSNGHYEVKVDDQHHSDHKWKQKAFGAVVEIIRTNDWTPVKGK